MVTDSLRARAKQTIAIADEAIRDSLQSEIISLTYADASTNFTPHIATMFEAMMRQFGGPDGMARCIKSTYLAAPQGSHTRAKILSDIQKMGMAVTDEGRSRSVDQMDDAELKITHDRVMQRLTKKATDVPLGTEANNEREVSEADRGEVGAG
jgi:hypothetical protein